MQATNKPLDSLDLPPVFPENSTAAPPISTNNLGSLPSPASQIDIPLPRRDNPPRVVIADEEEDIFEAIQRSLKGQYQGTLDVRFWRPAKAPDEGPDLLETVEVWMKEGWRPDAVVIDINFDDGGKHGVQYLKELREKPGFAALAVVLATGNQYSDLDQGRLTVGTKKPGVDPADWLKKAKPLAPEAILYSKTADAWFLGRIGEHIDDWKRAARRRAWIKLLGEVAELLDGRNIEVKDVAQKIVDFTVDELGADDAFVRRRDLRGSYALVASKAADLKHIEDKYQLLAIEKAPLLQKMVEKNRDPVIRDAVSEADAGADFQDFVAGRRFIGVGVVLGERNVGFITLLRKPDRQPFEEEVDGHHLKVLARLLASALRVRTLEERQTGVLGFAKEIALSAERNKVCQKLAETLHAELHGMDHRQGKVTVRLLDFGSGKLERAAHIGLQARNETIHFDNPRSVYAEVVRTNESKLVPDVTNSTMYVDTVCERGIHSELCVPLSIGKYAVGAVNLEHKLQDYYRAYDQDFVRAAATLAANAIKRIRTARVLKETTDFVHRFPREKTEELDNRLRTLLYEFCGYSVLVDLGRENGEMSPWRARLVCKYEASDVYLIQQQMDKIYAENWHETWVGRRYSEGAWRTTWAEFTDDPEDFYGINLTPAGDKVTHQKGDAILWLRREDSPPHRAILLMWFLPPPMGPDDIRHLDSIAKLFSELDTRGQHVRDLVQQNLIGEQAAEIGHVMQHFRHRLGSLTGGQESHIDALESAFRHGNNARFEKALAALRSNAKDIANSFHKSRAYVKAMKRGPVRMREIVAMAKNDLNGRLSGVRLSEDIPDEFTVETDRDIAALVLYSLMENSLDATEGQTERLISIRALREDNALCLQVADNGPGVPEDVRKNLFKWGKTTKTDGLGSALAFAKTRMERVAGKLRFPLPQPKRGALFEMWLPTANEPENMQ